MIQIHQNVNVQYNTNLRCVVMEWTGHINNEQLKLGANKAVELLKNQKSKSILNNLLNTTHFNFDKQDWVVDEWFPQVVDAGLEKYAVVVKPDFLKTLDPKRIKTQVGNLSIHYFAELTQAQQWLGQK